MLAASISIFNSKEINHKSGLFLDESLKSLFDSSITFLEECYNQKIEITAESIDIINEVWEIVEVKCEKDGFEKFNGFILCDWAEVERNPELWKTNPKPRALMIKTEKYPKTSSYAFFISELIGILSNKQDHSIVITDSN